MLLLLPPNKQLFLMLPNTHQIILWLGRLLVNNDYKNCIENTKKKNVNSFDIENTKKKKSYIININ